MNYAAEHDPLCYPGSSVLINLADLREQDQLDEFEAAMFSLRSAEPWPVGELGVDYYRALHRHLFQDAYSWAGRFRTVRIAKGGNWFCYPEHIAREMEQLFEWAGDRAWFTRHGRADFPKDAAHFTAELNAIHPYREGNGRTQLAFLSVLCEASGLPFNDFKLVPARVLSAMISSFTGQLSALEALIEDVIAADD